MPEGIYYRYVYITRNWYGKAIYNSKVISYGCSKSQRLKSINDFEDAYECVVLSMEEIKV